MGTDQPRSKSCLGVMVICTSIHPRNWAAEQTFSYRSPNRMRHLMKNQVDSLRGVWLCLTELTLSEDEPGSREEHSCVQCCQMWVSRLPQGAPAGHEQLLQACTPPHHGVSEVPTVSLRGFSCPCSSEAGEIMLWASVASSRVL